MNIKDFIEMQKMPYEFKTQLAINRGLEFYEHCEGNVFVSLGGIDSATLTLTLWKHVNRDIPAVTISSIEQKSVQEMHRQLAQMGPVIFLKPLMTKVEVIREFGYPIIAKDKAARIKHLQTPKNPKQTFIHAIMTGDMGEQGHYQHSEKIKLPDKWLALFGGLYQEHRPDLYCRVAPFKVSDECCFWMKEKPISNWAKENHRYPYMGLMASEGGQRQWGLMKNGCNYYGKHTIRSCPFATFTRQDILQLALDIRTPIPAVYGEIKRQLDGTLETTRAKRTGCSMCGFGIHIESRPHRFDRLRHDNPKEWEFWMYTQGWGKVLDYIGVEWENEVEIQGKLELAEAL